MSTFNPYDCEHPDQAIRWRTRRNGVVACVMQCVCCGREVRGVRRSDPARQALTYQEPFDEALLEQVQGSYHEALEEQVAQRQAERMAAAGEWWQQYNAYLLSAQWREKRQRVLERDGFLCQACRRRPATQAHHLTYRHVFNEPLFDLVAVCMVCHQALHEAHAAEEAA